MKKQNIQAIDIAKMLIANGWKPNPCKKFLKLDKNGLSTTCGGYGYLTDERYAVTLKRKVMTIHDGNRSFCKIMSMQYSETELEIDRLVCGKIIFIA